MRKVVSNGGGGLGGFAVGKVVFEADKEPIRAGGTRELIGGAVVEDGGGGQGELP